MSLADTTIWLVIAGVSVGTYALRGSFLLGIERIGDLPESVTRLLPFVPTAVLAALIAPRLLLADGSLAVSLGNERLLAGLVAVPVAWYTEDMLATVGVGMGALYVLLWL